MIPEQLPDPVKDAWQAANEANMTPEELDLQQRRLDFQRSLAEYKDVAVHQNQKQIAVNLIQANITDDAGIAKTTGLTLDEVITLREGLAKNGR